MLTALALWWLMSLTAYRITRLIVKDTFPPVLWIRDRLAGGWRPLTAKERAAPVAVPWRNQTEEHDGVMERYVVRWRWVPHWLAELLSCPWCASAYVSGALILAMDLTTGVPWPWLMGVAVWAGASVMASREWL